MENKKGYSGPKTSGFIWALIILIILVLVLFGGGAGALITIGGTLAGISPTAWIIIVIVIIFLFLLNRRR